MTQFTITNLEADVVQDGAAARGRLPTIFTAIAAKRFRPLALTATARSPRCSTPSRREPLTFMGAAVVLGTVGALPGWLPAPRVSHRPGGGAKKELTNP